MSVAAFATSTPTLTMKRHKHIILFALLAVFFPGCGCEKTAPSSYQPPKEERSASADDALNNRQDKQQADSKTNDVKRTDESSESSAGATANNRNKADNEKNSSKNAEQSEKSGKASDSENEASNKAARRNGNSENETAESKTNGKDDSDKNWRDLLPGFLQSKSDGGSKGSTPNPSKVLADIEKSLAQARKAGSRGKNEQAFELANEAAEAIRKNEYCQFGSDGQGKDVERFQRALDEALELAELYGKQVEEKSYNNEPQVFVF